MIINYYGALGLARTLASNAHLTLELSKSGETQPRTDGRTIYVGVPDPLWTEDEFEAWLYTLYHEINHNVPECRDCFEISETRDLNKFEFMCLNTLEDHRVDSFEFDRYLGKKRTVNHGASVLIRKTLDTLNEKGYEGDDEFRDALNTLLAFQYHARAKWSPACTGLGDSLISSLNERCQGWYDQILDERSYLERLQEASSAEDVLKLTEDIRREVFQLDESKLPPPLAAPACGGAGKGEAGDGDGEGEGVPAEGWVDYEELFVHKHAGEQEKREGGAPLHISYENYKGERGYLPCPNPIVKHVKELHKGTGYDVKQLTGRITHGVSSNSLTKSMRKLLQVRSTAHYEGSKRRGRLHVKNLYKARTGHDDVFKERVESSVLDTSVVILTDMSGSMYGTKIETAGKCTTLLNSALSPLGIDYECLAFSDTHEGVYNLILKEGHEHLTEEKFIEHFSTGWDHLGNCNADGESILWAAGRLLSKRQKRKVLIVISDGQPAGYGMWSRSNDIYGFTKRVIKDLEKRGDIEIYGIGVEDSTVKDLYSNNSVIDSSDQLEAALVKVIKRAILNI